MLTELFSKKEKKVEYIELIYDLIFVYIIGRNNALLHITDGGFVKPKAFLAYVFCTLAVIQIWNFTTFYINMFGKNGVREHIFLFVNMYLMYFIGQSVGTDFEKHILQFHIAWGLILVNIGLQYLIEIHAHKADAWNGDICKRMLIPLFVEALLVFIGGFVEITLGVALSALAIFTGIILTIIVRRKNPASPIDFAHLTERAMLYVVFTFGEMIIAVSAYFNIGEGRSKNALYFSFMAFMIVVGLFLSYGFVYDYLINREGEYSGMAYMLIHIFIVFALNNITASLEFMREEEVDLLPKVLFMVGSLVMYFLFLLALKGHAKCNCKPSAAFIISLCAVTAAFIALMLLLRENMYVNIFISVSYVFGVYTIIYGFYKDFKKKADPEKQ